MEGRFDGGFLTIGLVAPDCGPSGRAAGYEAAEQHDECDGDELDAKAR
jgi:hypothetical protein